MEKVGCVLLLAVTACAGSVSSGSDGAGGAGSSAAAASTAAAGSSGAAGSSAAADSGAAGSSDALAVCVADDTVPPPASPVSGSVVGERLRATICSGAATAFVEVTQGSLAVASQTVLIFSSPTNEGPQTHFRIEVPTEAIEGRMNGLLGMTGPTPGTYTSESGCGALGLYVTLPIPADLVCSGSATCPPGCALEGPVSSPYCQPVTPTLGYGAKAVNNCVYGTEIPRGSWSVTLTSVDAYAPDMDAPTKRFVAHGTLTAELLNEDGSDDSVQLSVAF